MDKDEWKSKWGINCYDNGAFLLGANFNTNSHYGEREFYLNIYIGKWTVTVGKFVAWS